MQMNDNCGISMYKILFYGFLKIVSTTVHLKHKLRNNIQDLWYQRET